jgi:hypothetical protein
MAGAAEGDSFGIAIGTTSRWWLGDLHHSEELHWVKGVFSTLLKIFTLIPVRVGTRPDRSLVSPE